MFERIFHKKNKLLKILCIADTHGNILKTDMDFLKEKFDDIDVVICLGDIRKDELKIICSISKTDILAIKGNHDNRNQFDEFSNIINIHKNLFTFNDIKIIGLEGSIKYNNYVVAYTQEESIKIAKNMPQGADILITHSHMYCEDDKKLSEYDSHIGLKGSRYYFDYNNCVNIHGHDHIETTLKNSKELCVYGFQKVLYNNNNLKLI